MSLPDGPGFRVSGPQPLTISDDLRRSNTAAVLRAVLVGGPLARSEIADSLGMTRATVTRVSGQLIDVGLLREGEPRRPSMGRPLIPLELGGSERLALTVHIGAMEIRVGVVNIRGEVLSEDRHRYTEPDPTSVAALIARAVDEVVAGLPTSSELLGLSASIGGWVDPSGEIIVDYRPLGWRDVPLKSVLPDIGLPRYFDQLVRGLALAESMFGAARGAPDFLELWTGNVLGAAVMTDGVVRRGPRGGAGGIDHMPTRLRGLRCTCGRNDCLHSVATDDAFIEAAVEAGVLRPGGSMRTLLEIVRDGDPLAAELVETRAAELGRATAVMVDLVSPGVLVIAGLATTIPGYLEAFTREFRAATDQAALTPVVPSAFGDLAPTVATASFLLDAFFHDPLAFERRSTIKALH